ncbi:hypothetical protein FRB99_004118 [Tulasnella sp. 403]|nr:hypothetical protein FRB99_004118 [Tulasnella sp. 403]
MSGHALATRRRVVPLLTYEFTPSGRLLANDSPCQHKKALRVCQDRQNHSQPIVFYTNAEYNIFNGCGYCKWAKKHPAANEVDKTFNKGWPGCCRPPKLGEMDYIDEHDWPIVAKRYKMPNPHQLKDRPTRPMGHAKSASRSGSSARRGSIEVPKEERETRSRNSSSPHRRGSPRMVEQAKGSPRSQPEEVLVKDPYRVLPPSMARSPPSAGQQSITTAYIVAEERQPGVYHTRPVARNGQVPATTPVPGGMVQQDAQSLSRNSTIRKTADARPPPTTPPSGDPRSLTDISRDFEGLALSPTGSNRESITTVMSDSAFTDYLSDESEAELQKQAEARAAQLRRLRAEEAEFNAAKRGLANVDLQTPVAWSAMPAQPYNPSAYARR